MRFKTTIPALATVLLLILPAAGATADDLHAVSAPALAATPIPHDPVLPPATGEDLVVGSRKSRDSDELDQFIEQTMAQYHIPGVVACVVKNDRIAWTGVYGHADIVGGVQAADTTVFMLASISKTFVATAVAKLWEDGLLELGNNINDYLPFPVVHPGYPLRAIKVRHLLTHTSSIARNDADWIPFITWGADSPLELGEFLENWLVPGGTYYKEDNYLNNPPGTVGQYSNIAFALAGYLVQCVSGQSLEDYCQANIFGPLGMYEASWFLAGLDPSHVAMPTGYLHGAYFQYGHAGLPVYPAGQLRTSAPLLARHLLAFMGLGEYDGVRILDTATAEAMRTVQFPGLPVSGLYFGLGWYRINSPYGFLWGHNGGLYGVYTDMYCSLDENWGVINLTNGDGSEGSGLITNALLQFAYDLDPTPALLVNFTAVRRGAAAELTWQLATTPAGRGFHVWRRLDSADPVRLTVEPVTGETRFTYTDPVAPREEVVYMLQDVGLDGTESWFGTARLAAAVQPALLVLAGNHPNPFNPRTTIEFSLPTPDHVTVAVYDAFGRYVTTLLDGDRSAGEHLCVWDGGDRHGMSVAGGVYFCRVWTERAARTLKMTLLK